MHADKHCMVDFHNTNRALYRTDLGKLFSAICLGIRVWYELCRLFIWRKGHRYSQIADLHCSCNRDRVWRLFSPCRRLPEKRQRFFCFSGLWSNHIDFVFHRLQIYKKGVNWYFVHFMQIVFGTYVGVFINICFLSCICLCADSCWDCSLFCQSGNCGRISLADKDGFHKKQATK